MEKRDKGSKKIEPTEYEIIDIIKGQRMHVPSNEIKEFIEYMKKEMET